MVLQKTWTERFNDDRRLLLPWSAGNKRKLLGSYYGSARSDLIHTLKDQHSEQKKKGFDFSSTLSIMVLGLTFTVPEVVIRIIIELAKHIPGRRIPRK
jgi:hypothetical protein